MSDDAPSGVHTVTMADIPFDAVRQHWASLSTWPPHMAAAWVAEPTWEEIVAQARRQTGAPRMREASEAVLTALIDGRLTAYGMRVDKTLGRRPPEKITPDDWKDLIWIGGTLSTAAINKHTSTEMFHDVQIDRLRLFSLWPDAEAKSVSNLADEKRHFETPSTASEDAIDVSFPEVQDDMPSEMLMLPTPLTKQERLNELARGYGPGLLRRCSPTNKKPGDPDEYPFQEALERDLPGPVRRDTEGKEAWTHYRFNNGPGRPKRSVNNGSEQK